MAIDRKGRLGVLTNIFTGSTETSGKTRGHLINNYLNGNDKASEYMKSLSEDDSVYNPFNLCLLEMDFEGTYKGRYYCRGKEGHVVKTQGPDEIQTTTVGLGNHPMGNAFQKTEKGKALFDNIIQKFNDTSKTDELNDELEKLMLDTNRCFPDPQMELQGANSAFEPVSSIYINGLPDYGTRVQTFITIDHDLNVAFREKFRSPNGDWSWNNFDFKVQI